LLLFARVNLCVEDFSKSNLMKQLLIHIGTHKTGTTAIQNALRANRKLLAQNGCAYVDEAYELSRCLKEPALAEAEFEALKKKFKCLVSEASHDRVIFSSEQFAGTILKNYTDSSFIAQRLKDIFPKHSVSLIVYFRRQDHFIESAYTQFVQMGQPWSFDRFRDFVDFSKFDWNVVVDNYRQYFQSVDIHMYDRTQLTGGDVVVDFFSWLGLPVDSRLRIIRGSNYSISRAAVEVARVGNVYLDEASKERLWQLLRSRDRRQPYGDNPYFTVQERKALLEHYRAANEKLAAAAGADLEKPFTPVLVAAPPGMESADVTVDSDAAVRLLIDICVERHSVPWIHKMRGLVGRFHNKLRQYIPW
jgi:hypothetical protein